MRDVENDSLYTSPSCDVTTSHVGRRFSALGWGYLLLVLAIYVGALALQLAAGYLWPQAFSAWWWNWLLSLAPLYGVGLPLLWVILRRIPAAPHALIVDPDTLNRTIVKSRRSGKFGDLSVKLCQFSKTQRRIFFQTPLPPGMSHTPVVALPRQIDPLRMPELIAHKV